ncbi:hypothetical protein GCM10027514_19160 [Azotobacter armeniacus]
MANDSGNTKGRRCVQGGRFEIRRMLYMATLTAAKAQPAIRAFDERLLAARQATQGGAGRLHVQAAEHAQCHGQSQPA